MNIPGKALSSTIALCLLLSAAANAQSFLQSLQQYNSGYPQEKIHIHFDKSVYNTGETIWFKAYLKSQNYPSRISTNLYTELLDESGKLIERKKSPIYEATAAGSFELPQKLNGKGVVFRAYTTWQLNFDSTAVFNQYLNIASSPTSSELPGERKLTLRFFPEGGDLIIDLNSVVAFSSSDERGFPANVSGIVKDGSGKPVTTFVSVHDGMGTFNLVPKSNEAYTAEWQDGSGRVHQTNLPRAKPSGVSFHVADKGSYISYVISRSEDVIPSQKKLRIIAQMHGRLFYRAAMSLEESSIISGIIRSDSLTTGIIQLTVFDNDWKPLAERILFLNQNDFSFHTLINADSGNLNKRGKNIIEIEVPDTIKTNLSVSVTDAALSEKLENIYTGFLLTVDLRGYIHNPAYYFSLPDDSVKQHLDLLMLTHGWRKYNWEDIAANKFPVLKYLPEQYLTLKGKVNGIPAVQLPSASQLNLILQTKDSARQFVSVPVNKSGEFYLDGLIFYDTVSVFYTFNANKKLSNTAIVDFIREQNPVLKAGIDADWVLRMTGIKPELSRINFFSQKRTQVIPELNKKIKTLEEVIVRSHIRQQDARLDDKYASGLFQSGNSKLFNVISDPDAISKSNAFHYLQGQIAGLEINGSGRDYTLNWRGDTPAIFLDERQLAGWEIPDIAIIPISEIALIKVFSPPFVGAFGNGASGAIAIYLKKGGDGDTTRRKGLIKGTVIGYSSWKQFYSPDYATFNPLHEVEDVRSTLYWQPYVLTDKENRKVRLEFYNNDVTTSYRIVIEGMNEQGKLTRVEKIVAQ
jgi:hypothetical protein